MKQDEAPERMTDRLLRQYLGYRMKRAYLLIHGDAQAALAPLGLRITTSSALHMIVENAGLRQSQLAQALSIERSRAVLLVDELEKAGLIARHKVPQDRRSYALRPTDAGVALCISAAEALKTHEDRALAALDETERATLARLLGKLTSVETSNVNEDNS